MTATFEFLLAFSTALLQILLALVSPFLQMVLGVRVVRLAARGLDHDEPELSRAHYFLLGLLTSLIATFYLKFLGLPWWLATTVPLVFGVSWVELRKLWAKGLPKIGLNFVLWFTVVLGIGISLFQATDGIQTPWRNNYGDLTFHLGMITSFVSGDNFPPEYHIFAGQPMSYPWLMNLWSSSLWWPNFSFGALSIIFAYQWVVVWVLVFFFLRGDRFWLLPWAVLFGGGSYFAPDGALAFGLNDDGPFSLNSGQIIPKGFPWSSFIATVWVPQRTAMLGAAVLLGAVSLAHESFSKGDSHWEHAPIRMLVCGLLLGLLLLGHSHLSAVGIAYVGLLTLIEVAHRLVQPWSPEDSESLRERILPLLYFCFGLSTLLLSVYWVMGKAGIAKLTAGWLIASLRPDGIVASLAASGKMWLVNAFAWLVMVVILWARTLWFKRFIPLLIVFLLANFVQIAVWEWDQLKIFIGIYIVSLHLWTQLKGREAVFLQFMIVPLIVPAAFDCFTSFYKGENFTIYPQKVVEQAEQVRKTTEPDDVILAAPDHNSLVTLTGRKLYYGYEGTLWTHALKHDYRKQLMYAGPEAVFKGCSEERENPPACPDYLLWSDAENRYKRWKGTELGPQFEDIGIGFLYRYRR